MKNVFLSVTAQASITPLQVYMQQSKACETPRYEPQHPMPLGWYQPLPLRPAEGTSEAWKRPFGCDTCHSNLCPPFVSCFASSLPPATPTINYHYCAINLLPLSKKIPPPSLSAWKVYRAHGFETGGQWLD